MRYKSMVLHLIRCGETTWEGERRMAGSTDLPLSEPGRQSIVAGIDRLRGVEIGSIYHSPDEAATATAATLAAPIGARTRSSAALADPDLGLLEGLTEQEFSERFPKRFREWQDDPLALAPREAHHRGALAHLRGHREGPQAFQARIGGNRPSSDRAGAAAVLARRRAAEGDVDDAPRAAADRAVHAPGAGDRRADAGVAGGNRGILNDSAAAGPISDDCPQFHLPDWTTAMSSGSIDSWWKEPDT
jgi:hypothetical protein